MMIFCPKCKSVSALIENYGPSECKLKLSEVLSIPVQLYICNDPHCKLRFLIHSSHL